MDTQHSERVMTRSKECTSTFLSWAIGVIKFGRLLSASDVTSMQSKLSAFRLVKTTFEGSVTRYGKNSPIGQFFKMPLAVFECSLSIRQKLTLLWRKAFAVGPICLVVNG